MSTFIIGKAIRVEAAFSDPLTTAPLDPGTVRLRVKKPDKSVLDWTFGPDPEVIKDDVGRYHAILDADQSGRWSLYWNSTGAGQDAEEVEFTVRAAKTLSP